MGFRIGVWVRAHFFTRNSFSNIFETQLKDEETSCISLILFDNPKGLIVYAFLNHSIIITLIEKYVYVSVNL